MRQFWTGIVGGLAGVIIGLIISLILALILGRSAMPLNRILAACEFGGAIGVVLGLVYAKPKTPTRPTH